MIASSRQRVSESGRAIYSRAQFALYGSAILYVAVVVAAIWHHEPWADEAQSWLLARDASLLELWTRLMHYEGSPGLWQTLLHILTGVGVPYVGLNITSGVLGFSAIWLLLRNAPFPLGIRLTLPFTFYLCYQYAVVARSYSLLPLLLFACAMVYPETGVQRSAATRDKGPVRRYWLFTILLCLLAAVSIHGMVLSFSIWLVFQFSVAAEYFDTASAERKKLLAAAAVYLIVVALLAASAWPAKDVRFTPYPNYSMEHLLTVSANAFSQAFTGEWILSAAMVALSIPFLWRGRGLVVFALSSVLLCAVFGLIYSQVWHQGLLFLVWLFAIWIAANNTKITTPAIAALIVVIAFQCYWTIQSVRYDWSYPYSGSQEAARFLQQADIPRLQLYAIGYACTGIQPYFAANIFANFNPGRRVAYWDWSSRNHVNQDSENLAALRPDYVLVGYKGIGEHLIWTRLVKKAGYQMERHFDGNVFWHTRVLEPEAFDLYRRWDLK